MTVQLTVQASNGVTFGVVLADPVINAPASSIPITFNDPMFTGMTALTSRVTLSNNQTLNRRSIVESSGEPSITCLGNNTITFCRVNSRECVRVTDNNVTITNCYLESTGVGSDHADTIQAYSPGANGGTVRVTNTHIRAHTTAATAGYWTADSWSGTIVLDNVIIQGGPYGFRAHPDPGCHINFNFNNVFFVGPFGAAAYLIRDIGSGTHTIQQWNNVRNATIVNGVLVPGSLIPSP